MPAWRVIIEGRAEFTLYALRDEDDSDDEFDSGDNGFDFDDEDEDEASATCEPTRDPDVVGSPLPPAESIHAVLQSRRVQLLLEQEQDEQEEKDDDESDWS